MSQRVQSNDLVMFLAILLQHLGETVLKINTVIKEEADMLF